MATNERFILIKRLILPTCILVLTIVAFAAGYLALCDIPGHGIKPGTQGYLDCLYFSVVTISSLGYGDLQPVGASRILACVEVVAGLVFIGVYVSRIVSFKQDQMIEYVVHARVIQTFDECLDIIREAKEELADQSRKLQITSKIEPAQFSLNRSNPFYQSKRAMEILNGYIHHTITAGRTVGLDSRFDRAANHVEELAGVVKRFISRLDLVDQSWRTERSLGLIANFCSRVAEFEDEFVSLTKYKAKTYKGPSSYSQIVKKHVEEIRAKLTDHSRVDA